MKKHILILVILAMIIVILSLFHYAFYQSWIGLIGCGIGLLLLTITVRLRKPEFKERMKNMGKKEKKLKKFMKIILYCVLAINLLISFYMLYKDNIKSFVFIFELTIMIFFSNWRMP